MKNLLSILLLVSTLSPLRADSPFVDDIINPIGQHEDHFFGKVEIVAPRERAFSDAGDSQVYIRTSTVKGAQSKVIRTRKVPTAQSITESVGVLKGKTVAVQYRGGGTLNIAKETPNGDGFNIRVALKRIDVNDMLITRQDGSTYYAKGRYCMYAMHDRDWTQVTCASTKTGMDVPPGYRYEINVSAVTEEGIQKAEKFSVDFTHGELSDSMAKGYTCIVRPLPFSGFGCSADYYGTGSTEATAKSNAFAACPSKCNCAFVRCEQSLVLAN
jgi:hypothetical protein